MATNLNLDDELAAAENLTGSATGWADKILTLLTRLVKSDQNPFGSAATKNVGTAAGEVPILGTDGQLPASVGGFPSGTRMLFQQTAAPTGWTKQTAYSNRALRVVSGTVGFGGTNSFTTVFGSNKKTANHTLTVAQMPSHSHQYYKSLSIKVFDASPKRQTVGNNPGLTNNTDSAGSGQGHSHGLTMNLRYVDVIIARKN